MTYSNLGFNAAYQGAFAFPVKIVPTEVAIAEYLEACRYDGKRPATLRTYRWALRRLARGCSTLPADPKEVRRVLADEKLMLESRMGLRRNLSAFFSWAAMEYNHPHPIKQLPRLKKRRTLPRVLTAEELQRLWDAPATPREQALVALTLDNGLRIGEIATLQRPSIDTKSCLVDGKTGPRRVPLSPQVRNLLMQVGEGNILWMGKRGPLTTWGVNQIYRRLFARAGIVGRKVGPHTLRHTFATTYYRGGGKLPQLQEIMGHADLKTTMIYVHLAGSDVDEDHSAHSPVHAFTLEPMGELIAGGSRSGVKPGIGGPSPPS